MIIGLGIDLIELGRIKDQMNREKFVQRILTKDEQEKYTGLSDKRKLEYLAGRFAAKEAYAKALGTGIGAELSFQDIEVINHSSGKPILTDKRRPEQLTHTAITHTDSAASAVVIIESINS
jgi:holo-[acyl-carrier protein] synthase